MSVKAGAVSQVLIPLKDSVTSVNDVEFAAFCS